MAWIIGIIAIVLLAVWLLVVMNKMGQSKKDDQDFILAKIATEYVERRQNGSSIPQIKESLFQQFSVTEPAQFWYGSYNPIPFGNLILASFTKLMPKEALCLGEIAYTISCHRGIYPIPRESEGPRDSACEYDALTRIRVKCQTQMILWETGGQKLDSALWEMMRRWAASETEIGNAAMIGPPPDREPPRPQMLSTTRGTDVSMGLFSTRWLMPMDQVLERVPHSELSRSSNSIHHLGAYRGRNATFGYLFHNNQLMEITLYLNNSSEDEFTRMQAELSAEFSALPPPLPAEGPWEGKTSRTTVGGVAIEHSLVDMKRGISLTEMIRFHKVA